LHKTRESEGFRKSAGFLRDNVAILAEHPMKDRYTRVTAPAGCDGQATRRDYYFRTRNTAREFRLRIKRWKAEQKYSAGMLSFDDSDKRGLAYLRAHVGDLELSPAIVTHRKESPASWIAPVEYSLSKSSLISPDAVTPIRRPASAAAGPFSTQPSGPRPVGCFFRRGRSTRMNPDMGALPPVRLGPP